MEDREARERVRTLMETRPSARPPDFVNPLEKIEQLLTCPICLDRYKVPKLLPCQHTFCLPCLEGCAESAGRLLKCPECRAEHSIPYDGVKAFQTNYTLTGFLDIHLQATSETSSQIEEYIHRYNLERCKICDEKAECENCAHCDRRACKECRGSHMEMLKRDLGRVLNQVKRLSNRIIEASDGVAKGMELMTLNCETTKTEVKEYFHRYTRELRKREEHLMFEIEQFHSNENRLLSNLRDVLELESSNMSEAVSRLDAALKGECEIDDADLIRFKNSFTEGLEYLRNFQPDAEELFCKKIRFAPGDDAAKLPQAITSFGELTVLVPQFAGRYLTLESSYLPRPFRFGLESDMYRGRKEKEDEASRPTSRYGRVEDESSLRYRRRQQLEEEAWSRLHGNSTPGASPWSRSPLPETLSAPESHVPSKSPVPATSSVNSKPPTVPSSSIIKPAPIPIPSSSASSSKGPNAAKPPLPRQRSSIEDTSLNEKIETIRRAHEKRTGSVLPGIPPSSAESSSAANTTAESSEAESTEDTPIPRLPSSSSPGRSRIRIICRASSVTRGDPMDSLTVQSSEDEPPPSPIPIQHYPGEDSSSFFSSSLSSSVNVPSLLREESPPTTPAWLARRRARFARSKTNPDLAAAFGLTTTASPRVQQLLHERRQSRLDSSTAIRVGAPPCAYNEDGEVTGGVTPPQTPTERTSRRRHQSLTREAAEYKKLPLRVFGRKGAKEGELNWPRGMASLPGGLLAIADSSNHRICIFCVSDGRFIRSLGEYGSGKGQLDSCAGVAAGRGRQLIVSDRYNHRVVVYDAEGEVTAVWGGHGPNNGRFNNPWGVAVSETGTIYVVDKDNHRVQMFDKQGNFLGRFGSVGHGDGQLNSPLFVAINRMTHEVYITDSSNNRVCVFDSHGIFKFAWGEEGFQAGQFKMPRGIAIDQKGNVIVADSGNNRVQIFSSQGDFIATFGSWGSSAGQLKGIEAVCVIPDGSIVVSDRDNHRIQVFN